MKQILKTVAINIVLSFSVIGLFLVTPAVTSKLSRLFYVVKSQREETRPSLPNYKGTDWAKTHFYEFRQAQSTYRDYIVWRHLPFTGQTINIDNDGVRQSTPPSAPVSETTYIFHGGSTVWGIGSRDQDTIASQFARQYNVRTLNFGELAYIARQSLAFLTNRYIEQKITPGRNVIVFYDGVNDVIMRCRTDTSSLSTDREKQITSRMKDGDMRPTKFRYLIEPWRLFINELSRITTPTQPQDQKTYDCATSPQRAQEIAETLVSTWYLAQKLAQSHGDAFLAVLQPNAHVGSPERRHLPEVRQNVAMTEQYKAVYPRIREVVKKYPDLHFVDLTHIFDGDEMIFIDNSHVVPKGNAIIARHIGQHLGL